jgi:hypothetical protein
MTKFDRNEIENYWAGSPLWYGPADRILVTGVNDDEFWEDLLTGKGGPGWKKNLDCPENRATLIRKYHDLNPNQPIVRSVLTDLMYRMMIIVSPELVLPHYKSPEPEDDRPRDALGRVMSPKAIQWQEWESWCSLPDTRMVDIQAMRRNNADFAEFYATLSARQRVHDDPMAEVNTRLNTFAPKKAVPADVLAFAQLYRTLSSQQVKSLLNPGINPLGPADAAENKRLFDAACACGAI